MYPCPSIIICLRHLVVVSTKNSLQMPDQWVYNGRKYIQFTVLGSCGVYLSAKGSFDQPIFDVWLASTLYRYVSQDGQIQTGKELSQASLACIPAYDGHNGPS